MEDADRHAVRLGREQAQHVNVTSGQSCEQAKIWSTARQQVGDYLVAKFFGQAGDLLFGERKFDIRDIGYFHSLFGLCRRININVP